MAHLDMLNFGNGSFINLNGMLYNTNAIVSVKITANENLKGLLRKKSFSTREFLFGVEMFTLNISKTEITAKLCAEFNIAGEIVELELPNHALQVGEEYKTSWHIDETQKERFHKEHDFFVKVLEKAKQKLIKKVLSELQDELNKKPAG